MKRTGFTLVEILIVVVILGILAAIVIPQFTDAANDARDSSVQSDLQTLRSAVELYKVQHCELLPNQTQAANGTITSDAAVANFVSRLTGKTDINGTINAAGAYGPYLQKFPTNPNSSTATIGATPVFGTTDPGAASATAGWFFNTTTGKTTACATVAQTAW